MTETLLSSGLPCTARLASDLVFQRLQTPHQVMSLSRVSAMVCLYLNGERVALFSMNPRRLERCLSHDIPALSGIDRERFSGESVLDVMDVVRVLDAPVLIPGLDTPVRVENDANALLGAFGSSEGMLRFASVFSLGKTRVDGTRHGQILPLSLRSFTLGAGA